MANIHCSTASNPKSVNSHVYFFHARIQNRDNWNCERFELFRLFRTFSKVTEYFFTISILWSDLKLIIISLIPHIVFVRDIQPELEISNGCRSENWNTNASRKNAWQHWTTLTCLNINRPEGSDSNGWKSECDSNDKEAQWALSCDDEGPIDL